MINMIVYIVSFLVIAVAFCLIRVNFVDLREHDEGTEEMKEQARLAALRRYT